MSDEIPRSRQARLAAEQALVRVVHHYGGRPEFVVLGGLVPELLCSGSARQHAGTTDIDVQVNLESNVVPRIPPGSSARYEMRNSSRTVSRSGDGGS
jgi:hypothetical protein